VFLETKKTYKSQSLQIGLDWIEQCFMSPPTQYRLYGTLVLLVKRSNQQYQSTEGTNSTQTNITAKLAKYFINTWQTNNYQA